jgi:outer membrane protein, multidrug efflux system
MAILNRRPDVRADELSLVKANAQVGISQANMYPALTITAGTGFESMKTNNWFNIPGSLFGLAGATLVQPVLQGRQLKTQYEIAKEQREQAVIRFRQTVLTAAIEVSDALISINKLGEQEVLAKQRTDTLSAAVGNAQLLFKNDMADYLEVITAQQTALNAQLSLASIQNSALGARVNCIGHLVEDGSDNLFQYHSGLVITTRLNCQYVFGIRRQICGTYPPASPQRVAC